MSEEPYTLVWAPRERRALTRLPEKAATACIEFAYGPLSENPARVGHSLRLDFEGLHSARRGDFRLIYEIREDARAVIVLTIEHRSAVYRRR